MSSWTVLLLLGQAAFAVIGLRLLIRHVFPALPTIQQPRLIGDVWAPLLLVGPLLFYGARIGVSVEGLGWAPIGGPVCIGVMAVGAALAVGGASDRAPAVSGYAYACWAATGLVLLTLGVAYDLTFWSGQCAFALAAVMLWMNTPRPDELDSSPETQRAGLALLAALVCVLGQGGLSLLLGPPALSVSVALMVAYAVAAAAGAVRTAGFAWSVRIAGWAASVGLLFGVGIISFSDIAPRAIAFAINRSASMDPRVAHSFGVYALEGTLLLLLPAAPLISRRLARLPRILLGALLMGLGAAVAAWRIAEM